MKWFVIRQPGGPIEYVSLRRLKYLAHRSIVFGAEEGRRRVEYWPARGQRPSLGFALVVRTRPGETQVEWRAA